MNIMNREERIWWVAIVAILAWSLMVTLVGAQSAPVCASSEEVTQHNINQGHELVFLGLDFEGNVLEIWHDPEGGNYGVLITSMQGEEMVTCYINGGTVLAITPEQAPNL